MTTFWPIFSHLKAQYLDDLAFLSLLIYAPNMSTNFRDFLDFLTSISIEEQNAKSADISSLDLGNAYAGYLFMKNTVKKFLYCLYL